MTTFGSICVIEWLYSGILHVGSRVSLEYARNEGSDRARCLPFQLQVIKLSLRFLLFLIIQPSLLSLRRSLRESLSFNSFS